MEKSQIDINKLYDLFIAENTKLDLAKTNILENFREVESNFKKYEDALTELEKEKISSKIDSYQNLSEKVIEKLKDFNPENIESNIPAVKNEIAGIKEAGEDLSKVSQKFRHIENMWISFIERNNTLDKNSVFIKNIFVSIKEIKKKFNSVELIDLERIEEDIIDLNQNIERAISMVETLLRVLDENDFIGKEPKQLEEKIKSFVSEDYKHMTLLELNDFYKEIEAEIDFYKKERVIKRIKAKVIKIISKENQAIYNYGIEINGKLIYVSEKLTTNEILEDTKEFLYLDNYPIYGIAPLKEIPNIEVADEQFYANKELNDVSLILFGTAILASIIILSFTIFGGTSPIFTVPFIFLIQGLFSFLFTGLKYRMSSKYKVKNMFYFFKISYYFVKVGDDGLDVQKVVPKILEVFNQTVDNNLSLEKGK